MLVFFLVNRSDVGFSTLDASPHSFHRKFTARMDDGIRLNATVSSIHVFGIGWYVSEKWYSSTLPFSCISVHFIRFGVAFGKTLEEFVIFLTKFKESKPFSMHFILVYHSVIATANISDRCKSMIWPFILLKMLNHKRASEWKKNYCVCVCVFDGFHVFHDIPSTTQSLWKRCRSNGKTKCAQNGLEFIFIFEIFWLII